MSSKHREQSTSLVPDLKSGLMVALIALPLSLGIAMASGFPPVAGVLTAVIGGVLVTFLGSARLTIKGPAAGLIVIVLGAVMELGAGDPILGYRRALAVGVLAAAVQIAFALARVATVGVAMSPSVVHGMLAAIGVIIMAKQAHVILGVKPEGSEPLELILEVPRSLGRLNPEIFLLGLLALVVLFLLPRVKARWTRFVPAPVMALAVVVPLGFVFDLQHPHHYNLLAHDYEVGPEFLVTLPGSLLEAIVTPDFSVVTSAVSIKYVVMYALVGTIESTLSVLAVDAMDPARRRSDLNRDLLAVGVGNLASAFIGGLPMISEIVRSKANVDAGAVSKRSNLVHGLVLLVFVGLLPGLLHAIPLAALAAMLVYTGARLAAPAQFVHARHIGTDQLVLFLATMVVTLATDLLVGVGVGLLLKFGYHLSRGLSPRALLRPRVEVERLGKRLVLRFPDAAAFAALMPTERCVGDLPEGVEEVVFDLSRAQVVDHTFLQRVHCMSQEWPSASLSITGLAGLERASSDPMAAGWRRSRPGRPGR